MLHCWGMRISNELQIITLLYEGEAVGFICRNVIRVGCASKNKSNP